MGGGEPGGDGGTSCELCELDGPMGGGGGGRCRLGDETKECELDGRVLSEKRISTGWFLLSSMALPIFVTPPPEMLQ